MKHVFFTLFLGLSFSVFSGGFRFPNVDYAFAKLYLLNIDLGEQAMYADYDVYRNGYYANTKIGDGIELSESVLNSIHDVLKTGVDELINGLGKCYIPRHGIIYFDKIGTPVASFSICFECDRISIWSVHELPPFKSPKRAQNFKKAEGQMDELREIFSMNELPYYLNEIEYVEKINSDENLLNNGKIEITDPNLDSLYYNHYSKENVQLWVHLLARRFRLEETTHTKYTAGGDKWEFPALEDQRGTLFLFTPDEAPVLAEAYINNSAIILPNGVSVGMSLDDVIGTLGVYDGSSNPEWIILKDEKMSIEYQFKYHTLTNINLRFRVD